MEVKNGTEKVYDNEFKIQAVKLEERSVSARLQKNWGLTSTRFMDGINAPKTPDWIWDQNPDPGYSYEPYRRGAETQAAKQGTGKRDRPPKRRK